MEFQKITSTQKLIFLAQTESSPEKLVGIAKRFGEISSQPRLDQIQQLSSILLAHSSAYSKPQLTSLVQVYRKGCLTSQAGDVFCKALFDQLNAQELTRNIQFYSKTFSLSIWVCAVKRLVVVAPQQVKNLFEKCFNYALLDSTSVSYSSSQAKELAKLVEPYQIRLELDSDPELLTAKIKSWFPRNAADLICFVKKNVENFNVIHWACFATKLHECRHFLSEKEIKDAQEVLAQLSLETLKSAEVGQIVQMLGGFAPLLYQFPDILEALLGHFDELYRQVTDEEKILIFSAIRQLDKSAAYPLLERMKAIMVDNRPRLEALSPAVLAMMLQCWGGHGFAPKYDCLLRHIELVLDDLTAPQLNQVLLGHAGEYEAGHLPRQDISIPKLARRMMVLYDDFNSASLIDLAIAAQALSSLLYCEDEWVNFVLVCGRKETTSVAIKAELAIALVRSGAQSGEVKEFVREVGVLCEDKKAFKTLNPMDRVRLPHAIAKAFGADEKTLVEALIKLLVGPLNEIDLSMLESTRKLIERVID